MKTLKKGQMITNSKGISYYQIGNKYYSNSGFFEKEITKELFIIEVEKAFNEVNA